MQRNGNRFARTFFVGAFVLALAGPAAAVDRPDAWVTTKVKMALLTSEGVRGNEVNVDTIGGRVTLHGAVGTATEKTRAEQIARTVDGVQEVRNLIQVVPDKVAAKVEATDEQLKERVTNALKADPALADASIAVQSVTNGVVLLGGKAATLTDAYRAVDDAAAVLGVRRVASEIQTPDTLGDAELWRDDAYDAAAYEKSAARDLWITTAAKMRLLANESTPALDINVDTDDRVVTLFGMVDSPAAKQAAETEVKKVEGVKKVVNDLQIVAPQRQEGVAQTDDQIEDAIDGRIDSFETLKTADIDVEVSSGVARLSGTVTSRRDQMTALTIARSAQGVKRVIDDLRLEPPAVSAR